MKNPWMKFYPSDWRADPALRMCSLAARGLWVEMMALMHEADPYGHLVVRGKIPTEAQIAMLVGAAPDEVEILIGELEAAGVFSRTRAGVIYSRRMVRDEKKLSAQSKIGQRGGNPALKGEYNERGYLYLMGFRADGAVKIGVSVNPANRLKKIRAQYRGDDIRILSMWLVDDMGKTERTLHEKFVEKSDGEWFSLSKEDIEYIWNILDPKGSSKEAPLPQKPEARSQKPEARLFPPTPLKRGSVSDGFAAFWQAYPKKVGKGQAEKAYAKALKATNHETIMAACQRYAADRAGKDPQYTRHAATWLNGQCWLDEGIAAEPDLTGPEFERVNGLELFKWRVYYADWQAGKPWDVPRLGPPPDQKGTRCPVEMIEEESEE